MHYMYIPYVDDRAAFTLSHSSAFCTDLKDVKWYLLVKHEFTVSLTVLLPGSLDVVFGEVDR